MIMLSCIPLSNTFRPVNILVRVDLAGPLDPLPGVRGIALVYPGDPESLSGVLLESPSDFPLEVPMLQRDFYEIFKVSPWDRGLTFYRAKDGSGFRAGAITLKDGRCISVVTRAI